VAAWGRRADRPYGRKKAQKLQLLNVVKICEFG
jgi:hypothetical protein